MIYIIYTFYEDDILFTVENCNYKKFIADGVTHLSL